ncbi:MAG: putative low-complexity protein, partial [Flavobacteriales bacterium]
MKQIKKTTIAAALGAVVIGSLTSVSVQANSNPFSINSLESGYMQIAPEGKCGEGKCGGDKA